MWIRRGCAGRESLREDELHIFCRKMVVGVGDKYHDGDHGGGERRTYLRGRS